MIVLVESHPYQPDALSGIIDPRYLMSTPKGGVQLNYVGYLVESGNGSESVNSIIILPKVFRDASGKVFGHYIPEDLLTLHNEPDADTPRPTVRERLQAEGKLDFLFRFSVWLYRAIRQFRQRHKDSVLPELASLTEVSGTGKADLSELEVVLALVRFHRDNNSLLTHIKRVNTAQRHSVSWGRTVARQQPILQNGRPVYMQPLVKQKHINYDEELIILYLSTLADLRQQYGFRLELNPLYTLLSKRDMEGFRERAVRRLKEIRGKYFSDTLVRVWQLLMLYYSRQEQMRTQKSFREVLLVRDFNIVFEDMIDYLLSDPDASIPQRLKEQRDGKIVDHIYAYHDLIQPEHDTIYHIGDSKYYRAENELGDISIFKQYTYARNVIQQNVDLLNEGTLPVPLRYREELTEGYNPTPNFFISALVNESLDFSQADLKFRKDYDQNRHFKGRLFDRDTLMLQAYNVNFLFVLNAYVAGNATQRNTFRQSTRQLFRDRLVDYLTNHYEFWRVTPTTEPLEDFVNRHFRALIGRMYRPSDFTNAILVAYPINDPIDLPALFGESVQVAYYALRKAQTMLIGK